MASLPRVARPPRPQRLGLPGPTTWQMARGALAIRQDPIAFLEAVWAEHGDLVSLPVPGPPVLLVTDPAGVRQVLQTNARNWTKQTFQYAALASVTGPGLLAAFGGDGWLGRRRLAQPAFHHERLDALADAAAAAAASAAATWAHVPASGRVVDVDALALRMTLDVVGRTLFGQDLSAETARLVEATEAAAELVVQQGRSLPRPAWLPSRMRRRMRRAVATLDVVAQRVIERRRTAGVARQDADLLAQLLRAGLPDRDVRDELVTMVVAGHETVAAALSWTLMLLAEHPTHQDRVRGEARAGCVDMRSSRPWTRAVIEESLRLYPPGWILSRRAIGPDTVAGADLPAGTTALVSPWLVHRRPQSWSDSLTFSPQRFAGREVTGQRGDYLPFGLGSRLCIGREFALVQLEGLIGGLLRDHELRLPTGFQRPRLNAFVTLRPRGGMPLLVRRVSGVVNGPRPPRRAPS